MLIPHEIDGYHFDGTQWIEGHPWEGQSCQVRYVKGDRTVYGVGPTFADAVEHVMDRIRRPISREADDCDWLPF